MKKCIALGIVFFLGTALSLHAVGLSAGIALGLNFGGVETDEYAEIVEEEEFVYSAPLVGFSAGPLARLQLGDYFGIQTELLFNQTRGGVAIDWTEGEIEEQFGEDDEDVRPFLIVEEAFLLLNIPVVATGRIPLFPFGSDDTVYLAAEAGGSFDIFLADLGTDIYFAANRFGGNSETTSEPERDLDWNRTGVSWLGGVGIELDDPDGLLRGLYVRFRQQFRGFGPNDDDEEERILNNLTISFRAATGL